MKIRTSCWTCKARRIRCDGNSPACENCAQVNRACEGYEPRLSWPRENDKKRSLVHHGTQPLELAANGPFGRYFINTTSSDAELYARLTSWKKSGFPIIPTPVISYEQQMGVRMKDLLKYFHDAAHLSLVTFGSSSVAIRDTIMNMTKRQGTPAGLTILLAVLAFSSLHRFGLQKQAIELKVLAMRYLSSSLHEQPPSTVGAAQHVASCMLLGSFESLLPSGVSPEWICHIRGAKDLIEATRLRTRANDSSTSTLIDWVYYHNTIARFSLRHWRHDALDLAPTILLGAASETRIASRFPTPSVYTPLPPSPNPSYAIMNLLSELCDTLLDPANPASQNLDYQTNLKSLDARIENVTSTLPKLERTSPSPAIELWVHQMATRVYLLRASETPFQVPEKLEPLLDAVFCGPVRWCTCEHFFPLLILSCEAKKDEHRIAILRLIERIRRDKRLRSIQVVKDAITTIWVQQDLNADNEVLLDYIGILNKAISSSRAIPSLA